MFNSYYFMRVFVDFVMCTDNMRTRVRNVICKAAAVIRFDAVLI
jgi:hypothetical protein